MKRRFQLLIVSQEHKFASSSPLPSSPPTPSEKRKQTCLKLYKTEHPMQNPQILSKALAKSSKTYIFPSQNTVQVHGYEPFCLDLLLKQGINETDIRVGCQNVPSISYTKENGKTGVYFPDIWIPKLNTLIEVKSHWTWLVRLQRNQLKLRASAQAGFNIYLYIFNPDGSLNTVNFHPAVLDWHR